jgi:hypothetical protein
MGGKGNILAKNKDPRKEESMCRPPIDLPSHEYCLEVEIDLGAGRADIVPTMVS